MNKKIEELVGKIIEAIEKVTQTPLPEEVIQNIRSKCSLLPKTPEIRITSKPQEFDSYARITNTFYQGSFGDSYRERTNTNVLYGDYKPGTSLTKDYPNNLHISVESHEVSDFSLNKMQVALSTAVYDENSNILVIYIPEVREWDEVSFKKFLENEQKQTLLKQLREKTKGKVTEEELHQLVDNFDFSDGIPDIEIISDPEKFDDATRETTDVYSDTFENDNSLDIDVKTLYGNFQPGSNIVFEHRGYISSTSESYNSSDFNLNSIQIVFVKNYQYRRFYNRKSEKEDSSIVIYLPEKEYEEKSYREFVEKKKNIHNFSQVANFAKIYVPNVLPKDLKVLLEQLDGIEKNNDEQDINVQEEK